MSKRNFFLALILITLPLLSLSFGKGKEGLFEGKVVDASGVAHTIQGLEIQQKSFSLLGGGGGDEGSSELTFLHGLAEVTIPFENITRIEAGERDTKFTQLVISLSTGKQLSGKIKSNTTLAGSQEYATSYKIEFQNIKTLEFSVSQELKKCPVCKRTYVPRK